MNDHDRCGTEASDRSVARVAVKTPQAGMGSRVPRKNAVSRLSRGFAGGRRAGGVTVTSKQASRSISGAAARRCPGITAAESAPRKASGHVASHRDSRATRSPPGTSARRRGRSRVRGPRQTSSNPPLLAAHRRSGQRPFPRCIGLRQRVVAWSRNRTCNSQISRLVLYPLSYPSSTSPPQTPCPEHARPSPVRGGSSAAGPVMLTSSKYEAREAEKVQRGGRGIDS